MVAAESLFDMGSMLGLIVALVLYIVAIATSYWIKDSTGKIHVGPTERCISGGSSSDDQPLAACSDMQAIEACVIIAIVFSAFALLMAFARFKIHRKSSFFAAPSDKVKLLFPLFVFLSGLFGLIAMAIWVNEVGTLSGFSYDYSFVLLVIAWIVDIVLGLLILAVFNN